MRTRIVRRGCRATVATKIVAAFLSIVANVVFILTTVALARPREPVPQRIISLIPAVTEMLFAIGAGPQVVAVSSFDAYPSEVKNLPRVGALLDPNVERILALKPDLVVVYASQADLKQQLARAGIPVFGYRHGGLSDVIATIRAVGARTDHAARATEMAGEIERGLDGIARRVAGRPRPQTLLVFGREPATLRGIYASGGVGFLDDMLRTAGGENVFADVKRESVEVSVELAITRRPDVILEVRAANSAMVAADRASEIGVWRTLSSIPAVRDGRVLFINDDRIVVPGPRVVEGVELIARALHPEAF
jgi:iron complex transport system substrate-binding protein